MTIQAVTCPQCGGTVEIRAAGWSVAVACGQCGSELDISRPEVTLITAWHESVAGLPLPIGRRGVLGDVEWEVIGALTRHDDEDEWHEFLLFNPYSGYAWLVLSGREWQFGRMPVDLPSSGTSGVRWRGRRFRRDGGATTMTVSRVAGEFYWQVRSGDTATGRSYIQGNDILSLEESDGEVTWTHLTTVRGADVARAFDVPDVTHDHAIGHAVHGFLAAPPMDDSDLPAMVGMGLVTALLALVLMLLVGGGSPVMHEAMAVPVGRSTTGTRLGTIVVERPWQFVKIRARMSDDASNRWIDLDYSLVNRNTQRSIDAYGLIEFYRGTDSDGPWTEGDHATSTLVAGVPRGTYDLYVDTNAHGWPSDPAPAYDPRLDPANPWALTAPSGTGSSGSWGNEETIAVAFEAWPGAMPWGNWWSELALLFTLPAVMIWWRYRDR